MLTSSTSGRCRINQPGSAVAAADRGHLAGLGGVEEKAGGTSVLPNRKAGNWENQAWAVRGPWLRLVARTIPLWPSRALPFVSRAQSLTPRTLSPQTLKVPGLQGSPFARRCRKNPGAGRVWSTPWPWCILVHPGGLVGWWAGGLVGWFAHEPN
ncbi:hypothetical protein BO71DRAFT_137832 [Aspergillus ellipticus CBS 707.79]|uniref:Uncharacterized protein n=1 Tax=Aspergillus ellipticus CBS 707.79 TaxID=1448320 RepID=A0A319DQ91_9EURO|nr:hypothetical protein BO71DRAFT_137832 [Aspergillus ellipticus CBS 707.79]